MFKNPLVLFNKLCGAAKVYLVISIISYIALFYQNYNEPKKYCVGMFQANTNCDNKFYFLLKLVYITFITYLLQMLCSKGYSAVSWLLVLLPFLFMFIGIALVFVSLIKF